MMTTMAEGTRSKRATGGTVSDAAGLSRTGNEKLDEVIRRTIGGMEAKQVFGAPIEREGVLYLPAAKVRGGGGAGGDTEGNGGGGFGLTAKPAGMYVIRNGDAEWRPALDLNRVIIGGQLVAIVALLVLRSILRRR
jgi:uncharacterized spore protein YtfJ